MLQMQQQIQALQMTIKQRQDIEGVRQQAETQRELMRQTTKAHATETNAETRAHDVATRAITAQNVAKEYVSFMLPSQMVRTCLN